MSITDRHKPNSLFKMFSPADFKVQGFLLLFVLLSFLQFWDSTCRSSLLFSTHLNPSQRWVNTGPVNSICTWSAASARSDDVTRPTQRTRSAENNYPTKHFHKTDFATINSTIFGTILFIAEYKSTLMSHLNTCEAT